MIKNLSGNFINEVGFGLSLELLRTEPSFLDSPNLRPWMESLSEGDRLEVAKMLKVREINAARNESFKKPFSWRGNSYQIDDKSVSAFLNVLVYINASSDATEVEWITLTNECVQLNCDDFQALFNAISLYRSEIVLKARALKDEIKAASSLEELEEVRW